MTRFCSAGPASGLAGDVAAGGRGGEHRRRDAAGVEDGRRTRGQARPGRPAAARARTRPRATRWRAATAGSRRRPWPRWCRSRCAYSARYSRQVLSATMITARRLGDRDRQPVDVLGQVERLDPLVGEAGQPGVEVADRLPPAEPGDAAGGPPGAGSASSDARSRLVTTTWPAGPRGHSPSRSAGDVTPSSTTAQRRWVRAQPVEEPLRGVGRLVARSRPGGAPALGQVQVGGRLRVAGDDRGPVAGRHPDQQVDRPGGPHRVREADRELGLAGTAGRLGRPAGRARAASGSPPAAGRAGWSRPGEARRPARTRSPGAR